MNKDSITQEQINKTSLFFKDAGLKLSNNEIKNMLLGGLVLQDIFNAAITGKESLLLDFEQLSYLAAHYQMITNLQTKS